MNRPGSFAEYLVIPAFNAFKLPDNIPDELAAIFDPFGNAVHTALSFDLVGEDVLITGAGPIGIMARCRLPSRWRPSRGDHRRQRIPAGTGPQDGRHPCRQRGQEKLSDVMEDLGMTEGFDVGLEMSGVPSAFQDMIDKMNHGGKIAMLGIPPSTMAIDWGKVIFKGLFIKGIYGREMFETWYKMASLIQSGLDLSPIITHHFHIDDFQQGFEAMGSGKSGKVILNWD